MFSFNYNNGTGLQLSNNDSPLPISESLHYINDQENGTSTMTTTSFNHFY